ncbi:uncharacterized protein LOC133028975 isoform X2 [Cannabis sativa]|uniref:uncharacterized protein LOC133028975 isoform X2 n=1 Tax=Cannabis sativa TaxID=3483 RepID=UPI0029C9DF31|nr:uncharacterized protein LOC133028975 isoform X2 [Cannabis sativa]
MNICSHHSLWLKPASFSSYGPLFWEKKDHPPSSSSSSYFSLSCGYVVCSVDKNESQQHFEVDQDKARDALKQLDQQLQSISQKQLRSPKIKASDVKLTTREEYDQDSEVEVVRHKTQQNLLVSSSTKRIWRPWGMSCGAGYRPPPST